MPAKTPVQAVAEDMLARLLGAAVDVVGPLPPGPGRDFNLGVTTARLREHGSGLGGYLGGANRDRLGDPETRVVRLDAEVRLEVVGNDSDTVTNRVQDLHNGLLGRLAALRKVGFLRLRAVETTVVDQIGPRWRKTASYDVIFEGRYFDPGQAGELIARIPIEGAGEPTTVTGSLVRWADDRDDPLIVHGPGEVTSIAVVARFPAAIPAIPVTILRTAGGLGPPADLATLDDFLTAVSGAAPATQEAKVVLPNMSALLAALGPALSIPPQPGEPPTEFGGRLRAVSPPIQLSGPADRLEFRRAPGALGGVVYVRAGGPLVTHGGTP